MTLYGYARVSVREPEDKNLDLQVERLVRAGCSLGNIRAEEASGARNDRGGLLELLDLVVEGDTLVVTHIDRLSRGLTHGLQVIEGLHRAGVEFRSLSEDFNTATATGKLQITMVLAFSEWWRNSIRERSVAGQAKARAEGRFPGRRPSLNERQREYIRAERSKGVSQRDLAKRLEVTDIYVMDLGSDVRRNPKISGTTHNVFGIQTGVAITFLVREKSRLGECNIHYASREDAEVARDKLAYLKGEGLENIPFETITPDAKGNWLNQSNSNFEQLIPLADRQTKLTKSTEEEQAVFGLHSLGVATNRDEWTYDFDVDVLSNKVRFFCATYQKELRRFAREKPVAIEVGNWVDRSIKWTSELEAHLAKGHALDFSSANIIPALYRPFTVKHFYYAPIIDHRRYQIPQIFPHGSGDENKTICFLGVGARRPFAALATTMTANLALFIDGTQCLPLYRHTANGERVSNITKWGIEHINGHYRREWGEEFQALAGEDGITAEQIFAYTYAVLHNPAYRHEYAVDLLREFPRLPLYRNFHHWAEMGQRLLDLHIGFESAETYPLERYDREAVDPTRAILRADKERGTITLDERTTLVGIPDQVWEYRLGSRSALEWVLDQYKERKPRDPTIREKFNTYRFSDHKENVIALLRRVCTVSVETMEIVDRMAYQERGVLVGEGCRKTPTANGETRQ